MNASAKQIAKLRKKFGLPQDNVEAKKRPKYNNKKTVVNGITFDSKKEAERWKVLKALERNGDICNLERQVKFDLVVNGIKVCSYIPDFRYVVCARGETVIEDVKGVKTSVYKLKKKLLKACLNLDVIET